MSRRRIGPAAGDRSRRRLKKLEAVLAAKLQADKVRAGQIGGAATRAVLLSRCELCSRSAMTGDILCRSHAASTGGARNEAAYESPDVSDVVRILAGMGIES